MTDYMTLHASAFPPSEWTFLPNRQPKPSQTSRNELWVEMTHRYQRSMATRQHLFYSNILSANATRANIRRMSPDVKELYDRQSLLALEDTAEVGDILDVAGKFVCSVDELKEHRMRTIPELEELGDSTEIESLGIEQAIKNAQNDKQRKDNEAPRRSFGARIKGIFCNFIRTPIHNHFRPSSAQIGLVDEEVNTHVALAQEQLTSDVAQLRDFLRGRLFDQYCLMRSTSMEKKDKTWLKYGECIISGYGNSDPEVADRLYRMINESGLDPNWVMGHIEDYHNGNEHIGQWQRYVRSRRWMDLAEKFTKDMEQLERINSAKPKSSRRCQIMFNIHNSTRLYFKRLDGPHAYQLSDKALQMEEEEESHESSSTSSSAAPPTISLATVS